MSVKLETVTKTVVKGVELKITVEQAIVLREILGRNVSNQGNAGALTSQLWEDLRSALKDYPCVDIFYNVPVIHFKDGSQKLVMDVVKSVEK